MKSKLACETKVMIGKMLPYYVHMEQMFAYQKYTYNWALL